MTPAVQHALREALADVIQEWAGLQGDWRPWPGQAADALIAGPLAPHLAAEAENTRLKETVEGLLPQKLCGESWGCPDEERVSITVTFGAIRVARSVLATIPPKENP